MLLILEEVVKIIVQKVLTNLKNIFEYVHLFINYYNSFKRHFTKTLQDQKTAT